MSTPAFFAEIRDSLDEADVVSLVRDRIAKAGGLRALSREWGVSPAMLSDLMNGRRGPGPKILTPLGLARVKVVRYARIV